MAPNCQTFSGSRLWQSSWSVLIGTYPRRPSRPWNFWESGSLWMWRIPWSYFPHITPTQQWGVMLWPACGRPMMRYILFITPAWLADTYIQKVSSLRRVTSNRLLHVCVCVGGGLEKRVTKGKYIHLDILVRFPEVFQVLLQWLLWDENWTEFQVCYMMGPSPRAFHWHQRLLVRKGI